MDKNLLIMGLDPGTTLAYALIDLEGNLIKIKSSKQFNSSSLTLETIKQGKVLIVATDVSKIPHFIRSFSKDIGAKVISPDEDLRITVKRGLIKNFKVKNRHEMAALSAAIYAYKKIRPLLKKIDNRVNKFNKEKIKELTIKKGFSIKRSLKTIQSNSQT
jgi:hypothetical protein